MMQSVPYIVLIFMMSFAAVSMLAVEAASSQEDEDAELSIRYRFVTVVSHNRTAIVLMLMTSILELVMAQHYYNLPADTIVLTICLSVLLWPIAITDFKMHLIPNRMLVVMLVTRFLILGFEFMFWSNQVGYILISGALAALGMMLVAMLCRLMSPNSVGMGDVKLLGIVGIYMGLDKIGGVMFPALIIMFLTSVYLLLSKKATRTTEIAFAPFILMGVITGSVLMGI